MRILKKHYYSDHVYTTRILAYFDTWCLDPSHHSLHKIHNYSLSFSTALSCPSWMTTFNDRKKAAILLSTSRWWYFYSFYIATAAEDLPHKDWRIQVTQQSGRQNSVGERVLSYVIITQYVHIRRCVFVCVCVTNCCVVSGELISVATTLGL